MLVARLKTLDEIYKSAIEIRLELYEGKKSEVAESLGVTIKTLYNKLREFDLEHHINHKWSQTKCIQKRKDRKKQVSEIPVELRKEPIGSVNGVRYDIEKQTKKDQG